MRANAQQPGLAIYEPENEADALGVEAMLRDEGIECVVLRYGDSAYPGIVDRGRPFGVVKVAESHAARARLLVDGWRGAVPEDLEQAFERAGAPGDLSEGQPAGRKLAVGLLLLLVLGFLVLSIVRQ